MNVFVVCFIVIQFIISTCANVNSSQSGIKEFSSNHTLNETKLKPDQGNAVVSSVTSHDHEEESKSDLFGRRFINFLSRRQSKVKVSKSNSIKSNYIKFAQSIKDTTDDFLSTFLPVILRSLSTIDLSDQCSLQLFKVIQGLYHQETWAFKRKLTITITIYCLRFLSLSRFTILLLINLLLRFIVQIVSLVAMVNDSKKLSTFLFSLLLLLGFFFHSL